MRSDCAHANTTMFMQWCVANHATMLIFTYCMHSCFHRYFRVMSCMCKMQARVSHLTRINSVYN